MTHPISHYPYLTAKMSRFIAFILFFIDAQAFNYVLPAYVLPASILGCYHPDSGRTCVLPEDRPINTIEPSIRHDNPDLGYLLFGLFSVITLSAVVSSLDYKPKHIDRIHVNDDNNVYYQPLPPILEEDENEEEEGEDPHIFHYNHPISTEVCGDPC